MFFVFCVYTRHRDARGTVTVYNQVKKLKQMEKRENIRTVIPDNNSCLFPSSFRHGFRLSCTQGKNRPQMFPLHKGGKTGVTRFLCTKGAKTGLSNLGCRPKTRGIVQSQICHILPVLETQFWYFTQKNCTGSLNILGTNDSSKRIVINRTSVVLLPVLKTHFKHPVRRKEHEQSIWDHTRKIRNRVPKILLVPARQSHMRAKCVCVYVCVCVCVCVCFRVCV